MYATYKIDLSNEYQLENYSSSYEGIPNYAKFDDLAKKVSTNGFLLMNDIADDWFPDIDTHVFISHSHADEKLACQFADYLMKEFKIKSFIDSKFWGHSIDLLKKIDNDYCLNENEETYSYELRNQSTSHIHMILATSLAKMMDKCECFIFLDTKNSNYSNSNKFYTRSVWINYEIYLSSLLKQKTPKRTNYSLNNILAEDANKSIKYIPTQYAIDLSKLKEIKLANFESFKAQQNYRDYQNNKDMLPQHALDFIYKKFPFIESK